MQQNLFYKVQHVLKHHNFLKNDLVNLKSDVDELDIDELKNIASALGSWKSKVDKLDVDKIKPDPVDLKKTKWCSR